MARVLVIDGEEWVAEMLAGSIREAGHEVTVCATAQTGLDAAAADPPDCIVCDVDLPDSDGFSVARQVRAMSGPAGVTPILFLAKQGGERLKGFHVGGDAWIEKPFRLDEVLAQLGAMVQMAARLREVRQRFSSAPPAGAPAMAGELSQASITTLLTVLEMEQRTGTFEVVSSGRRLRLELEDGGVATATIDGASVPGLDGLRALLGITAGRFTFTAAPPSPEPAKRGPHGRQPLGSLLIRAVRLDDREIASAAAPAAVAPPSASPPSSAFADGQSISPTADEAIDVEPDLVEVEPDLSSYRPPSR